MWSNNHFHILCIFINVAQYPLLYSNTPPYVWATNKVQHMHIIFNQTGMVANQDRATLLYYNENLDVREKNCVGAPIHRRPPCIAKAQDYI